MGTAWFAKIIVRLAVIIATLAIISVPARAQQFREIAAGWDAVASAPASTTDEYEPGPYLRGSIGTALTPRIRLRFDGEGMFFTLRSQLTLPCPPAGCASSLRQDQMRGIVGLSANVLVGLDPREIVYLLGGVGPYETFASENSLHIDGSLGAGVAIPVGNHFRVFAEAAWHGFLPTGSGPSWADPIALGIRF